MARVIARHCSVRKDGDILKVKLVADGLVVFKGSSPVDNPEKVAALLNVLKAKGLSLPKEKSDWW